MKNIHNKLDRSDIKQSKIQDILEHSSETSSQYLNADVMKNVLDSTPAGIGIIKNETIVWVNEAFCSMLDYDQNFLIGKSHKLFYPDQREYEIIERDLYPEIQQHGTGLIETKLVKKDDTWLNCRIRASQLDKKDFSKGIIFIVTDISEIKILQTQLHQSQKMEAIGVLAGGVSHDFNNILMGIQGHVSLMQIDLRDTEKIESHTKQINKLVKTASELTKRLLGFARGGKYQVSAINVNDLIPFILKLFTPARKDILVHESYANDLYIVDGDNSQLEQVFVNILINASQAMSKQGDIFISTKNITIKKDHEYPFEVNPGKYIKVSVKDTGIGMNHETQSKIFDPFFSTKSADDQKGRGLGLSTVYGIVKNHDGFILVDSFENKGSSFHVCLPASVQTNTIDIIEEETPLSIKKIQKGSETILLVDDEDEILDIGKGFLEKLGYKPLVARNGIEAIEIFKVYKNEISLVVLDLIMPKMHGTEVFAQIQKIQKNTKVLISTGYTFDDKIEVLMNQGCKGFLQKPFSLSTFSRVLRKILDEDENSEEA